MYGNLIKHVMRVKNLIVWAWISWITLAQCLAEKWEDIFVIEQRDHIWWNCYDYYDENWILVHKYWPHIFHTDIEEVRNYVNRFTEFTNYEHKVIGSVGWKLIPIPFNINSIYISFPKKLANKLEKTLLKYFPYNSKVTILELKKKSESEKDKNLSFLVDYIFEKVFKNYTIKQWWISADKINPSTINRVPIVISKDSKYFPNDKYQWMPVDWYTKMFEKMLNSSKINVQLNTKFSDIRNKIEYEKLYFTGSIDEYFDYKYWKLWYRKTLYDIETLNIQSYQENSVINYPNDYEYTRITEFKKFYPNSEFFTCDKTVICKEIPWIWEIDAYPISSTENHKLLKKYQEENKNSNVRFIWRLGRYSYLDMDKAIEQVFELLQKGNNNLANFVWKIWKFGYFDTNKTINQIFKAFQI